MKRFLFGAVLVATVLLSVGMAWGQSATPSAPFWTRQWTDWSHTPIESNERTTAYENTSLLQMQVGSYFIDHCYRYADWFVPNAATSFVTLANSGTTFNFNSYPGWTLYTTSSTTTGSATLTASAGADLAVSNVASGQGAILCKGNVCCFNVGSGNAPVKALFESKFSVPTFTAGTSAKSAAFTVGLANTVTATASGSVAWSTSVATYGPTQVLAFNVTSGAAAPVLGYTAIVNASSSGTIQNVSSVTVSASDLFRVRIDATTPTNIIFSYSKNAAEWQTLGTVTTLPFTVPLQPFAAVNKDADAAVVDVRVRYIGIQNVQP